MTIDEVLADLYVQELAEFIDEPTDIESEAEDDITGSNRNNYKHNTDR